MANPQDRTGLLSRALLPLLATATVLAAHPPLAWGWFLAVVLYAPLFAALAREPRWWLAPCVGVLIGLSQVMILTRWTVTTLNHPTAHLLTLASANGLIWALGTLAIWVMLRWNIFPPLLWAIIPLLEWLRINNPWFSAGYLLTAHVVSENLWIAQWCVLGGVWGLGYLLCAWSWWTWRIIETRGQGIKIWFLALVGFHLVGDAWCWFSSGEPTHFAQIAVVQEFAPRPRPGEAEPPRDPARYVARCNFILEQHPQAVLVLPECQLHQPIPVPGATVTSSAPQPADIAAILQDRFAVVGVVLPQADGDGKCREKYRNAAAVLTRAGLGDTVDKRIPAPIGEEGILVLLRPEPVLVCSNGWRLAIVLCSEQMDPDIWSRKQLRVEDEFDLQIILADSRWFHYSPLERRQSRAARRLLAIAYQRPVVLIANGGSEWIDANGRLRQEFPAEDSAGILNIAWKEPQTWGLAWARWCGIVVVLVLAFGFWFIRKQHSASGTQ